MAKKKLTKRAKKIWSWIIGGVLTLFVVSLFVLIFNWISMNAVPIVIITGAVLSVLIIMRVVSIKKVSKKIKKKFN